MQALQNYLSEIQTPDKALGHIALAAVVLVVFVFWPLTTGFFRMPGRGPNYPKYYYISERPWAYWLSIITFLVLGVLIALPAIAFYLRGW